MERVEHAMQLSDEEARQLSNELQDKRIAGEDDLALVTFISNRYRINKNDARAIYDNFDRGFKEGANAAMNADKTGGAEADPPINTDSVFRAAWRVGSRCFKLDLATARARKAERKEPTGLQVAGFIFFVVFCGLPALEMTGFGFGIPLSLSTALLLALIGGAVGGALICPKPFLAGIIGGTLAGPAGLLAVYYYTQGREQVSNIELVLVQGIASLPGFGIGVLLKKWLKPAAE
jgi:hypothetical protein